MITVLGASGFVGTHVTAYLDRSGHEFQAVPRGGALPDGRLGHVIYCIGVTGDFPERPWEAVDAHVCSLLRLAAEASFESILYLSSVRVYAGGAGPAREEDEIRLSPARAPDLYNASKALGEAITLSLGDRGRVARPSNVYGPGQSDSFIAEVVDEAVADGAVTFRSPPESSRDYIAVEDVARLLVDIALRGRERIYNVASGVATTNAELGALISATTGYEIRYAADAVASPVPAIDNRRIREEFGFSPKALETELPLLLERRP